VNGVTNQFDKALCYDPVLDKFSPLRFSGEFLFKMAQPGITLEQVDTLIGANLDLITQSFDSLSTSIVPELAAFDTGHLASFFRGPNLEATLETSEQGTDGQRIKLKIGFRPVSDAPTVYGSASRRENLQAAVSAGTKAWSIRRPASATCWWTPAIPGSSAGSRPRPSGHSSTASSRATSRRRGGDERRRLPSRHSGKRPRQIRAVFAAARHGPLQRDRDRHPHGKRDLDGGHAAELRAGQRRLPVSENR
jgi:hypothetical protein